MNVRERRPVGRSGVEVAPLGLGTAPLGDLFVRVGDDEARATVHAALETGVTLVDTAPYYGLGLSEHRVGDALRGAPPGSFVLATKVGRVLRPLPRGGQRADELWTGGLAFEPVVGYGYDALLRSYEDSLQRLGLPHVDLLAIHDLDLRALERDAFERHLRELESGARALEELRASGAVRGVGLGVTALGSIPRVLELLDLDYVLLAMQYTLLDQPALDEELPLCLKHAVGVVVGAPFASGVLAVEGEDGTYDYAAVPEAVRERVRRLRAACERHGVPLRAAALQFPLGHPAVVAVVPGALSAEQARANAEAFAAEIPGALWEELKAAGLLRADAPVPRVGPDGPPGA